MKKSFETPFCEVVRFGGKDIVSTSTCCDVGGIDMGIDDTVCGRGDAECGCTDLDYTVNCVDP